MTQAESQYPDDWLVIGEKDFARVERLLDQEDFELAGFCLQQAVEKFLKAFLLLQGWQLRRIHNLDALLDDAVEHDASFERFRDVCQKITAFYFMERYPLIMDSGMTEEDVSTSLDEVKELIDVIRARLNRNRE